jgi:heme exporter protein C
MTWKIILFILMTLVIIAGISFPIVAQPAAWYQFPDIPGLGEKAKIIFFHVPTAWLASLAFLMAMVYGVKYLRNKDLDDDSKSAAALQLGMMFSILATVTGSIWAKFNWGSFWNWDPRETSIFILLMIYGSLFALRSAIENEDKRARLSAVYSVIAFLTVPFFVFIMPRIMTGLHPGSANDDNSGPVVNFKMNGNMQMVFFTSLAAFTILYYWMWKLRYKAIIIKENLSKKIN